MLDFPTNPTLDQTYSFGGRTWRWNGTGWQLVAGAVPANSVDNAALVDGAVGTSKLADNAVTAGKIVDGAVGTAELADGSVTAGKIADGATNRLVQETAKSASGSNVEFTGIPSWVKRITLLLHGVSTSGTAGIRIHLGTSGGYETTNYASVSDVFSTTLTTTGATDGFQVTNTTNTTDLYSATAIITNITGNTWLCQIVGLRATSSFILSAGSKALGGVLTRLRVAAGSGSSFDAGTMNILYEG